MKFGIEKNGKFLRLDSDGKIDWTNDPFLAKLMPSEKHIIQLGKSVLNTDNFNVISFLCRKQVMGKATDYDY